MCSQPLGKSLLKENQCPVTGCRTSSAITVEVMFLYVDVVALLRLGSSYDITR